MDGCTSEFQRTNSFSLLQARKELLLNSEKVQLSKGNPDDHGCVQVKNNHFRCTKQPHSDTISETRSNQPQVIPSGCGELWYPLNTSVSYQSATLTHCWNQPWHAIGAPLPPDHLNWAPEIILQTSVTAWTGWVYWREQWHSLETAWKTTALGWETYPCLAAGKGSNNSCCLQPKFSAHAAVTGLHCAETTPTTCSIPLPPNAPSLALQGWVSHSHPMHSRTGRAGIYSLQEKESRPGFILSWTTFYGVWWKSKSTWVSCSPHIFLAYGWTSSINS